MLGRKNQQEGTTKSSKNNKNLIQPQVMVLDGTDKTVELPIRLDLNAYGGSYDTSNQLVLPSKKRQTIVKNDQQKITRILSKKQRKRLEKVVEKKKKKGNRASLLEALSKVQASPEELKQLTSIAAVQTKGLRNFRQGANPKTLETSTVEESSVKAEGAKRMNIVKGSRRKQIILDNDIKVKSINDPNVVGFESSGESEDEDLPKNEEVNDPPEDILNKKSSEVEEIGDKLVTNDITNKTKSAEDTSENQTVVVINDDPSTNGTADDSKNAGIQPKKETVRIPAVYVDVTRDEEIQKARLKLPILGEEQQIMEVINENSVIIIAGETGSGKTTQVPQFLYEAGYAINKQICVTEPRRIAAISMSQRVAEEMSLTTKEVSYLIRFEGNVTEDTKIKFMTDGVLLKEIQKDFLLSKYSVVILDEAHERSVNTDILIGFLSRIVPMRHKRGNPLKLIIMSATLRLEDFTANRRIFKIPPPVIDVKTRQYDVTLHFNKHTRENYVHECFKKVVKIHAQEPQGGILVFVTGQQEVNSLVRKLRRAFPYNPKKAAMQITEMEKEKSSDEELLDNGLKRKLLRKSKSNKRRKKLVVPQVNLDDYGCITMDDRVSDVDLSDDHLSDPDSDVDIDSNSQPLWVLPLYSMLPTHKQVQIFKPVPQGCRFCVISTNVAETSLTIPNIKYVVDSGRTKTKLYDKVTGVTSYVVTWCSKAAAKQRAGRAGRLGPGHCYRLYSSAVYEHEFKQFEAPEIQRKPVDDWYLQMKCMNFDKIVNFPFPTSPDLAQLKSAETRLKMLGALDDKEPCKVTPLGRVISKFPVLPRYGKMIALSHQQNLIQYTICLVAALSVQEVLLETPITHKTPEEFKAVRLRWKTLRRQWAGIGNSLLLGDNMVLLKAVGAAEYANSQGKLENFCQENGLRLKAVSEIRKIRLQLSNEIKLNEPDADVVVDPKLAPPTDLQAKLLRQILLCGLGDQIARKIPQEQARTDKTKNKYAYQANDMEDPVYLHSSSVLAGTLPEFVVYQEIYQTHEKMYMRGVSAVEPEWLPTYVPSLCNLSEPLSDPPPYYSAERDAILCSVTGSFGRQGWPLPRVEIEHPRTDLTVYYRLFTKFFLQGHVFVKLAKYVGSMLSDPSIMVKSWARLQPRTNALLRKMVAGGAESKEKLVELWKANPRYLLNEYLMWLPESAHGDVTLMWPPLD